MLTQPGTTWETVLGPEKKQPYFQELMERLNQARAQGSTLYPQPADCFNAFKYTPFENVRVVVVGQDPYHGPGQAHGLSFSVQPGVPIPPSLRNIYLELEQDVGMPQPSHGCLTSWAEQGVLLLNAVLTVEAGQPQSHATWGWHTFTDAVIQALNTHHEQLVFFLWGGHAQKKGATIDPKRHRVLKAPHPSPLSAHRGFLGCQHFSKANAHLKLYGLEPIDWASVAKGQ